MGVNVYITKKPIQFEAIQFTGNNFEECKVFLDGNYDNKLSYPNVKTALFGFI